MLSTVSFQRLKGEVWKIWTSCLVVLRRSSGRRTSPSRREVCFYALAGDVSQNSMLLYSPRARHVHRRALKRGEGVRGSAVQCSTQGAPPAFSTFSSVFMRAAMAFTSSFYVLHLHPRSRRRVSALFFPLHLPIVRRKRRLPAWFDWLTYQMLYF